MYYNRKNGFLVNIKLIFDLSQESEIIWNSYSLIDLCGTPGYLAPELLKAAMYENADGYGKEVDM